MDEGCAYAWTLCGYEAVEMEEYERAMAFYRTAIRTDARHYNAWYVLFFFFFFFFYQATSTADQKKVWDGASLSQNG